MVTTLSHRGNGDENNIDIYSNSPTSLHPPSDTVSIHSSTSIAHPSSSIPSHSPSTTTDHTSSSTAYPPSSNSMITESHNSLGSPPTCNGASTSPNHPHSTERSHTSNTTPQLPSITTHNTTTTHSPPTSNGPESIAENHIDSPKINKVTGEKEVSWERRRRDIVLRNMLMDMLLSLLSSAHMQLNSRYGNAHAILVEQLRLIT